MAYLGPCKCDNLNIFLPILIVRKKVVEADYMPRMTFRNIMGDILYSSISNGDAFNEINRRLGEDYPGGQVT